ncbi:T9SS type A sorting domain-containing protein [Maribellus sediminis]|uniref:T9SS type A sorting domain-containing protein n=1 Tax=Maribellus sediminis TaxID=2696285 RepID=UPI0014319003|nr:T9SS type A sorting domain-containing protein [Maribellus sediminis]
MPVPVRLYNSDRTLSADFRLNHVEDNQLFTVNPGFEVAEIELDPDYWLISKTAQIVSAPEKTQKRELHIYPNPGTGELNLSLSNFEQIQRCSIYSTDGGLMKIFDGSSKKLDITDLSSGTYFIKVETDKTTYREKLVKY